jgi:hypothetical protein
MKFRPLHSEVSSDRHATVDFTPTASSSQYQQQKLMDVELRLIIKTSVFMGMIESPSAPTKAV